MVDEYHKDCINTADHHKLATIDSHLKPGKLFVLHTKIIAIVQNRLKINLAAPYSLHSLWLQSLNKGSSEHSLQSTHLINQADKCVHCKYKEKQVKLRKK